MTDVWKPSVTVAAIVEHQGKFLMIEELTTDGIKLNQPAGHLDQGETPASGAIREALEESAWEIEPFGLLGIYLSRYTSARTGDDVTYLRFAFAAKALQHHPNQPLDEGIIRSLWMTPEELEATQHQHRSPLVLQCVKDFLAWQAGQRALTPLAHVYSNESIFTGVEVLPLS